MQAPDSVTRTAAASAEMCNIEQPVAIDLPAAGCGSLVLPVADKSLAPPTDLEPASTKPIPLQAEQAVNIATRQPETGSQEVAKDNQTRDPGGPEQSKTVDPASLLESTAKPAEVVPAVGATAVAGKISVPKAAKAGGMRAMLGRKAGKPKAAFPSSAISVGFSGAAKPQVRKSPDLSMT